MSVEAHESNGVSNGQASPAVGEAKPADYRPPAEVMDADAAQAFKDIFMDDPDLAPAPAPAIEEEAAPADEAAAEQVDDGKPKRKPRAWDAEMAERKARRDARKAEQAAQAALLEQRDAYRAELEELRVKTAALEARGTAMPGDPFDAVKELAKRQGVSPADMLTQLAEKLALDGAPGPAQLAQRHTSLEQELAAVKKKLEERERREEEQARQVEIQHRRNQEITGASQQLAKMVERYKDDLPWLSYVKPERLQATIRAMVHHAVVVEPNTKFLDDLFEDLDNHMSDTYELAYQGNGTRPNGKQPAGSRNPGPLGRKPEQQNGRAKPRTISNRHQASVASSAEGEHSDEELEQLARVEFRAALGKTD